MKYCISDLHLSPDEPHITEAFLHFLNYVAPHAEALYILGDFFEYYIGDDDQNPFIQSIIDALKQFTQTGFPVYLMHGNRDFLIGKTFAKMAGVTLISDPAFITINNKKILLMHGDSLCTTDIQHQRFRKITQKKWIQKLFLSLPLSFRRTLADAIRKDSMKKNHNKSMAMMDVTQSAVDLMLQTHQADKLIHGHTHRPMMTEKRIVLGSWETQPNYLKIEDDGNIEWIVLEQ